MKQFFPLSRGDALYLVGLIVFAGVAFMPWTREVQLAGVALIGWLMAGLMVVAPVVALIRVARERREHRP